MLYTLGATLFIMQGIVLYFLLTYKKQVEEIEVTIRSIYDEFEFFLNTQGYRE